MHVSPYCFDGNIIVIRDYLLQNTDKGGKVMRKYCHSCGKELDSLIPFKCKSCGKLFCKHHFLPENHCCPDLKPKPWIKPIYSPPVEPEIQTDPETPLTPEPISKPIKEPETKVEIEKILEDMGIEKKKPEKIKLSGSKKLSNRHLYKLKSWFFWKKHPHSRIYKTDLMVQIAFVSCLLSIISADNTAWSVA